MPVRDAETTLEVALRSLARQSFREFEAVCVNDGSVDSSGEIDVPVMSEAWPVRHTPEPSTAAG